MYYKIAVVWILAYCQLNCVIIANSIVPNIVRQKTFWRPMLAPIQSQEQEQIQEISWQKSVLVS